MPFLTRSILVATDLTDSAAVVLQTAAALAALSDADLHVVHALEEEGAPRAEDGQSPAASFGAASRRLQDQIRETLPPERDAISSRVESGRADDVIRRRAEQVEADLIVIGPHRRGAGDGGALGTTADRLMRTTDVPSLIVHAPLTLPLRRVLIPIDLSDAGRGALDIGFTWTTALRQPSRAAAATEVEVLHVTPAGGSAAEHAPAAVATQGLVEAEVREALERVGAGRFLRTEGRVEEGEDAVRQILERGRTLGADLVVLGTHGRGGGAREEVGSVSSAVAREAACPVLLVPPALWQARQRADRSLRRDPPPSQS